MYLEETSGRQINGCEKFFLTDDGEILCQTADLREIAEYISEERPDITEELIHKHESLRAFPGCGDLSISLSEKNEQLFLGFLFSLFYEGNFQGQFNADEY